VGTGDGVKVGVMVGLAVTVAVAVGVRVGVRVGVGVSVAQKAKAGFPHPLARKMNPRERTRAKRGIFIGHPGEKHAGRLSDYNSASHNYGKSN
jgi:hypothetical protein